MNKTMSGTDFDVLAALWDLAHYWYVAAIIIALALVGAA